MLFQPSPYCAAPSLGYEIGNGSGKGEKRKVFATQHVEIIFHCLLLGSYSRHCTIWTGKK